MIIFQFLFLLVISKFSPFVKLAQGNYYGKTLLKTNMFLGIPYALPPTGSRRFRAPVPITEQSNYTFDATEYGLACIPRNTESVAEYGEDCLNLDIYAPIQASNLPVIVFIFGGGFDAGNSHQRGVYNGASIINKFPKAVIVCINYRINVFGFLSGAEVAKEGSLNAGLLDQKLAFAWVRQNIKEFGGDPTRVTAWGQSAGAISIACHLMADKNQQLFDRAILISGPPSLIFLPVSYHQSDFDFIAKNAGCFNHTLGPLDCMRQMSAADLQAAGLNAPRFTPTLDNLTVVQTMYSFQKQSFSQIPVMLSTTENEGILPGRFVDSSNLNTSEDYIQRIETFCFDFLDRDQVLEIAGLYNYKNYANNYNAAFADFFSGLKTVTIDFLFKCPTSKLSQVFQNLEVPIYQARFSHLLGILRLGRGMTNSQSFHAEDLLFYWQYTKVLTPLERKLADRMTSYILSFASGEDFEPWSMYGNGWRFEIQKNRMVRDSDVDSKKCTTILRIVSEIIEKHLELQ